MLLERVAKRTDNPYGKTPEHRDEIVRYLDEVEPLLRPGAGTELDGQRPVSELADCVQALLDEDSHLPANRTELNSSG